MRREGGIDREGGRARPQVEWHLGYHDETLHEAMRSRGVVLEAWGSLGGPTAFNPGVALDDPRLQGIACELVGASAAVRGGRGIAWKRSEVRGEWPEARPDPALRRILG